MDVAVIRDGVVDVVYRDTELESMQTVEGATLVEAAPDTVFGGYLYENGEFAAPAAEVEPVPPSVTSAQAVIALKRAGLLASVTAALNANDDEEAAIWFTRAQIWERTNSNVLVLAQLLGLSETQVDDLFIAAANIQ